MEELFEVIKTFLTTRFNTELAEYDDPAPAPALPKITDKAVVFGAVDLEDDLPPVDLEEDLEPEDLELEEERELPEEVRPVVVFGSFSSTS